MLCRLGEVKGLTNLHYLTLSDKYRAGIYNAGLMTSDMMAEDKLCSIERAIYASSVPMSPRRAGWLLNVALTKGGMIAGDVVAHIGRGVILEKRTEENPTMSVFESQPIDGDYLKVFAIEGFNLESYRNNIAYYWNNDEEIGYTILFLKPYAIGTSWGYPLVPHPHGVMFDRDVETRELKKLVNSVEELTEKYTEHAEKYVKDPEVLPQSKPAVTWLLLKRTLEKIEDPSIRAFNAEPIPHLLEAALYTLFYGQFYNYSSQEVSPVVFYGLDRTLTGLKYKMTHLSSKGEQMTGVIEYEEGLIIYELVNQFANLIVLSGEEVIRAYEEDRNVKLPRPKEGNAIALLPCGEYITEAWIQVEEGVILGPLIGRENIKRAKRLMKGKRILDMGKNVILLEKNGESEYVDLLIHKK